MEDLLTAQFALPADLRELNLRTLTPFQRALMVTDGTVTKFIEAYTMEQIEILRLGQEVKLLSVDNEWLEAEKGTTVLVRQVLLRGKWSYTCYAYAPSLIVLDRLPQFIKDGLELEGGGIGRILYGNRWETHRELLWWGKETLKNVPDIIRDKTGEEALSRTYRIIAGGKPIMLINEKFPVQRDTLPAHH
ncbi:MAG: chorismate pyruvate-lyase family protein [Nitrospira sp.]